MLTTAIYIVLILFQSGRPYQSQLSDDIVHVHVKKAKALDWPDRRLQARGIAAGCPDTNL